MTPPVALFARRNYAFVCIGLAIATSAITGTAPAQTAGEIVTQPVRDVGIEKTEIPPLLVEVSKNPYSSTGTAGCGQISSGIAALTKVIGPDFSTSPAENKRDIAQIGGSAVVNSLIPFRGIVREVSGASAAERRKNAAIDAGIARRGYLRGLQSARKCRR
ncbi:hypothetical protein BH09PSE3_BH09PSE3_14530 [soil metagenome]